LRASRELSRNEPLVARNVITREDFERLQEAERVAAADVEAQKARIAAVELQLTYSSIESPITGMVGAAAKDVGSYVDAGPNGLLTTVHQVDPMYVRFFVTEQDILRFRRDLADGRIVSPKREELEVEITLADGSTYPHKAYIDFRDVEIDRRTGTSITRGSVPNPNGELIPGQFIYATIHGIRRVDVVCVPQDVVMQSPVGASVYVVNDSNIVESRAVILGQWSGANDWIIERGLEPGDLVVADRLMQVRPGSPVTIAAARNGPVVTGNKSSSPAGQRSAALESGQSQ
jgi:membrane fusion protein (multidrug efflux system)